MNYNYEEIESLLKLDLPKSTLKVDTFLEMAGFPHYENVISNIYAYYFDKANNHGFDDLFFQSLSNCIKQKAIKLDSKDTFIDRVKYLEGWSEWTVLREESIEGKRIDIFLQEVSEEDSNFIIIENKIYADLYNPLKVYWSKVKTDKKVGVVLSLYPEEPNHHGFINITHKELLIEVRKNLGTHIDSTTERDITLLKDFIINLKQQESMNEDTKELMEFYDEHKEKVEATLNFRNDLRSIFLEQVVELGRNLELEMKFLTAYDYRSLLIKNDSNTYLTFYFADEYQEKQYSFSISLELYKENRMKGDLIVGNDKLYTKHANTGIICDSESRQDWYRIASKYYHFKDIDFDLSNLQEIYKDEWLPFINDVQDLLTNE